MKQLFTLLFIASNTFISAQIINFPDANFKNALISTLCVDTDGDYLPDAVADQSPYDGEITIAEAALITFLDVSNNSISSLSGIENFIYLQRLYCNNNQITNLDINALVNLQSLECYGNQLPDLDVQGLTLLNRLFCNNNQLTELYIKNGNFEDSLYFYNNPNLTYICCDNNQVDEVQDYVDQINLNNCSVNSYCTFTPGGVYYTIQGQNKLDLNIDGCDINDPVYPNLKFQITDGNLTGDLISDASGNYYIPVEAGTYTITPVSYNPAYYDISPNNIQVNFPATTSPFIQDFCVSFIGVHHDVEITSYPLYHARPGFDVTYEVVYKNKGNQTENGEVNFYFEDDSLDYLTADVIPDNQGLGFLTWNYSNLLPNESRDINITFHCNSPTDIPPVNSGDTLFYTAIITGSPLEETPGDNTFTGQQLVVNSLDPNDKTCLEGNTLSPAMVGDYLHYLIRFENTGTYPAENIVVKDIIDTAMFEISSLELIQTSHNCYIRTLSGNQVEFVFDNINLPFTEPDKHGYVAFKLKTKPTLVLGDVVNNQAAIYFDYNLPVITNLTSTEVSCSLNAPTFEISQPATGQNNGSIMVSPNGPGYSYAWVPSNLTGSNPQDLPAGTYQVTVTEIATSCTAVSSVTLMNTVGTDNLQNEAFQLTLQPNPARDMLYLISEEKLEKAQVFDILGRLVLDTRIENKQINVASLNNGIYSLKVFSNKGYAVVKFLKV